MSWVLRMRHFCTTLRRRISFIYPWVRRFISYLTTRTIQHTLLRTRIPYGKTFVVIDTCVVGNLHGWPSVFGSLVSIVFVALVGSEAKCRLAMLASLLGCRCRLYLAIAIVTGCFRFILTCLGGYSITILHHWTIDILGLRSYTFESS
jgi:hypothetical protein